ncbi:protein-disulfide reductase DsbD domain-containing protein [Paraflavitalea sp. CAU 1676]|uniref:protein-disulfide reductase DsbD domain-containing protein n=1 Tax=Paraflavitalea sp. CAU 1676 TaxID=3032598 RepID=UPI0023D9CCB7|nr:protein-disulfide reductase DsbD domain-containing protein [Paraflavitalea sp. CAU 1676]MDF2187665.1 protein-disulfide reductase DsbD family protein [Paraflavitalea sp. CAU 1676]
MRSYFLLLLVTIGFSTLQAQDKAVNWTANARKIDNKTYEVRIVAEIGNNWHLYSQNAGPDMPAPTVISFNRNPLVLVNGKPKEVGKLITKKEAALDAVVNYYEQRVEFVQVVKLKGKVKTNFTGKVEYTVCNNTRCLPPADYDFTVNIGG